MAEPSDEPQPADEQVEGGAVKTFLEHLEDLRWMLIKSGAAILLGFFLGGFRALYRISRGKPVSSVFDEEFIRLNLRQ